ncbi:MAG: hypothetical protein K0Q76_2598 [Panacagrimonas sp.]|nr:hypothetical protein [Panacagrimonas sp.]MCC2657490.1 hypothetical protein [Panacagrimonas sp.]
MAGFTLADERETPRAAEDLGARAMQLRDGNGRITDPLVWSWLKEMSLHHWRCWGSQATGGGEGADIVRHIYARRRRSNRPSRSARG